MMKTNAEFVINIMADIGKKRQSGMLILQPPSSSLREACGKAI
jgi:hypothetical protein